MLGTRPRGSDPPLAFRLLRCSKCDRRCPLPWQVLPEAFGEHGRGYNRPESLNVHQALDPVQGEPPVQMCGSSACRCPLLLIATDNGLRLPAWNISRRNTTHGTSPPRNVAATAGRCWKSWAVCGKLWAMGNKDARRPEKKKPKQKKPTTPVAPPRRSTWEAPSKPIAP